MMNLEHGDCVFSGGLALAVEGPSKAEIQCVDNKDGTCSVSYLPTAPGEYNIIIKFADQQAEVIIDIFNHAIAASRSHIVTHFQEAFSVFLWSNERRMWGIRCNVGKVWSFSLVLLFYPTKGCLEKPSRIITIRRIGAERQFTFESEQLRHVSRFTALCGKRPRRVDCV